MQLKEYLAKEQMTIADFAVKLKISYHKIYWIVQGVQPKLDIARRIVQGTAGEVTYDDLIESSVSIKKE